MMHFAIILFQNKNLYIISLKAHLSKTIFITKFINYNTNIPS